MSRQERLHMTDEEWESYERRCRYRLDQAVEESFLKREKKRVRKRN